MKVKTRESGAEDTMGMTWAGAGRLIPRTSRRPRLSVASLDLERF
jgi:hypothetical protein